MKQTALQQISDPEPTEQDLDAVRRLLKAYGTHGVMEILATLLLETADEFPADRLTAETMDAFNESPLRWPELRKRLGK
jgi:hypothetical protein